MGGGNSTEYEQEVNMVTNVIMSSMQEQSTSQVNTQAATTNITMDNAKIRGVKFTNSAEIDMAQVASKMGESSNSADLATKILNELKEKSSEGFDKIGEINNDESTKLKTSISTTLKNTFQQIQSDSQSNNQTVTMNVKIVDSKVTDSEFTNSAKAKMSQISEAAAKIVNQVRSAVDVDNSADITKTNAFVDGIGAMWSGFSNAIGSFMNPMAAIWIILFVCVAAIFIFSPKENLEAIETGVSKGLDKI